MLPFRKIVASPLSVQLLISVGSVLFTALLCYFFTDFLGYRVVALLLLLVVSLLAMMVDILPVLVAAIVSALVWNFFFIPPALTLRISTPEDFLLFLMYFVVAILNAVLTARIRHAEKRARAEEEHQRTIQLYNTLLNTLSHELRTPIATIIGATDALRNNTLKLSEENKMMLLAEIETAGTRLNRQVENLLNMSRLESGFLKLSLDWCDVNELIHSVISTYDAESTHHRIVFHANDALPLFKLDRGLVAQVLHNLVHNAIQYTPAHTSIDIAAVAKEGSCLITISDQGSGFPPDALHAVFDKFYRLPHSIPGGTGLGLSIAKGFTEAHHGTLTLENLPTRGARFTITIPADSSDIHPQDNDDANDSNHR